jgi:predicted Zn-dependent peptidase
MSVDVTKLPSGLTVITDTMPHLETAALGVWTGVGGRDEKPNEHGISHLLEHMAFKGTTKRSSISTPGLRQRPPLIMRGC